MTLTTMLLMTLRSDNDVDDNDVDDNHVDDNDSVGMHLMKNE